VTIMPDGRRPAKVRLFETFTVRPWAEAVEGATLAAGCTVLAYGNDAEGYGPTLHVHPYDELFIVVEGSARFFVGDVIIEAHAGNVVHGPAGNPHRFENLGPGRLQTIDVHCSPRWIQADLNHC